MTGSMDVPPRRPLLRQDLRDHLPHFPQFFLSISPLPTPIQPHFPHPQDRPSTSYAPVLQPDLCGLDQLNHIQTPLVPRVQRDDPDYPGYTEPTRFRYPAMRIRGHPHSPFTVRAIPPPAT